MTCPTCGRRMTLVRPKQRAPYYPHRAVVRLL